jgi:histidinol-phosphate aminotransferase
LSPSAKEHLAELHRTNPHEDSRHGFLRLDMNEGVPGLPPDFIKETLAGVDQEYLATYPSHQNLQNKIAVHNQLALENIIVSNGSDAAIKYIFDAYVSPRDRVLLTDPTFAMYPVYCRMFETNLLTVAYNPDLSFPWDEFRAQLGPGVRLAVVVNPNNPTGHALTASQVLELVEQAAHHRILLVVDEAYFYYYHETVIQAVKEFRNLIVLRTFSKLCGMAALRLGYAAASAPIIENLRKVRPTFDINGLAVLFGERLLDHPEIIQALIREATMGKEFLMNKLAAAGIPFCAGSANFVLIHCGGKVDAVVRGLAQENILVSGGFQNDNLKPYVRVTVGHRINMERFWRAFLKVWDAQLD